MRLCVTKNDKYFRQKNNKRSCCKKRNTRFSQLNIIWNTNWLNLCFLENCRKQRQTFDKTAKTKKEGKTWSCIIQRSNTLGIAANFDILDQKIWQKPKIRGHTSICGGWYQKKTREVVGEDQQFREELIGKNTRQRFLLHLPPNKHLPKI